MAMSEGVFDTENTWITFHQPSPAMVRARFNITQIEIPTDDLENGERPDDDFLQMLIDEGIPVKMVPKEGSASSLSNAGIIMHQPSLTEAQNKSDIVFIMGNEGEELTLSDSLSALLSSTVSNFGNAIEVTGGNKPISTPLYLHYAPTIPESPEETMKQIDRSKCRRRVSVDVTGEGPIVPPSIAMEPCEPIKKCVRFDLPERKASIIGIYEYFPVPTPTTRKSRLSKHRQSRSRNSKKADVSTRDRKPKKRRVYSLKNSAQYEDPNFEDDLQENMEDYYLNLDIESCQTPGNDDSMGTLQRKESLHNLSQIIDEEEDASVEDDIDSTPPPKENMCGLFSWTPDWLQPYARVESYFIIFCLISLLQGMLYTYIHVVISTLEKRFHLSSRLTGLVLAGTDLSQIVFAIIIAFYGAYSHTPRWMGIGTVLSTAAAFLAAFPHFIYGVGQQAEELATSDLPPFDSINSMPSYNIELCELSPPEHCTNDESGPQPYYFVVVLLFVSQLMIGASSSIFWIVGLSFLDDCAGKRQAPLYLTVFTILRIVGPALGFILGGYCLTVWIDPQQNVNLSSRDPRWLGAWWLGFIILALMIGGVGMFYFCFPRKLSTGVKTLKGFDPLRQTQYDHEQDMKRPPDKARQGTNADFYSYLSQNSLPTSSLPSVKDFPRALRRLFTNKIWTANLFSNIMFILAFSGYWKFKPKYIEHQYRKSASTANFATGIATMVGSILGIGISGVILRWCRPRPKIVTGYNVFLSVFAISSLFVLMSMHCHSIEFAGHIPQKETWACSKHCSCSEAFNPVCAEDGNTVFYSPCYAGCSSVNVLVSPREYTDCSCIGRVKWKMVGGKYHGHEEPTLEEGWALQGFCPDKCRAFVFFIGLQIFCKMVFSTGRVIAILINLRSVEERDKSLSLGCMTVFITLFGFIPSSLFTGYIIDSACVVWQERCGNRGECEFYNNEKFRLLMHIVPAGLLVFSAIGDLIVYLNHDKLDLYGDAEYQRSLQKPTTNRSCLRQSSKGPQISSHI